MTQKEKAKAYDEALNRAKSLYGNTPKGSERYMAARIIFPELAESEDERIRKEIVGVIQKHYPNTPESYRWISWLVKQKESLHIPESCKENADSFTDGIIEVRSFQRGMEEGRRQEQEKQKEQKPEVNDPFDDEQFRRGYEAGKHDAMREQKPADEQFPPLEGLDAIKAKYYDDGFKNGFDEGVESVKPVEWSEEDIEKMVNARARKSGTTKSEMCFYRQGIKDTLKSLRPSWKPSEEQMKALENVIKCELSAGLHTRARILQTLQNDLKKL